MNFNIKLSVHDLVDFVLRTGDIDTRIFNNATMLEGSRIHRYYQSKMNDDYQSEVFLSYECEYDGFFVQIEGRADGIIVKDDYIIVDEIKSCVGDIEAFHKTNESWHLGQAKVYAFLYCKKYNFTDANVMLTYISQDDNNLTKKYHYSYKIEELEMFFFELLKEYLSYQRFLINHKQNLNENVGTLKFPFETMNLYQNDLIEFVKSIEETRNQRALIEAPTGIGKTISVLYPSIVNLDKYDRIFYLTAKNSGKEIVDDTLVNLIDENVGLKSIILTAKDKICFLKDGVCNPEVCPFARGYYEKIKEALISSFLSNEKIYNYEYIKRVSLQYEICPFEFQLDLSLFCDLIIGDYNYIFDPFVYLKRYLDNDVSNSLLLVDEGHNLLDRCRGMYSISFDVNAIENAKKSLKHVKNTPVKTNLNKIKKYLLSFNDLFDNNDIFSVKLFEPTFINLLSKFTELYSSFSSNQAKEVTKEYKGLFNSINRFLKIYELSYTEPFFTYYFKKIGSENVEANIYCISPSKFINTTSKRFKNNIVFSATLNPFDYYNQLLFEADQTTEMVAFDSPFDSKKLNLNVSGEVSIKYKDRLTTLNTVISQIIAFVSVKKGNYFVFVPSYEYLRLLKKELVLEGVEFIYQDREMNDWDKLKFINKFNEDTENTKVGICVLGGSFSESINLVGETLIGVVIVGVGLPSISYENDELKKYYDSLGLNGFYYAYVIPGMKNVIQSVGRLIRTKNDYGSVLLIDSRYKQSTYYKLFRKEWKNIKFIKKDYEIIENLNIFYKKILNQ